MMTAFAFVGQAAGSSVVPTQINPAGAPGASGKDGAPGSPGATGAPGLPGPPGVIQSIAGVTKASISLSDIGAATRANPALTGVGSLLEGRTTAAPASHGSLVVQNSSTTAEDILIPQQPPGVFKVDGVRSVITNHAGAASGTTSAFGAYAISNTTQDTCGWFSTTVANADYGTVWGLNPTVIDAPTNGFQTAGVGRQLVGIEVDISVTSPNTRVSGVNVTGSSGVQPAGSAGFQVGNMFAASPGNVFWTYGVSIDDATCTTALLIGCQGLSGSNRSSMPVAWNYRNGSGVIGAVTTQAIGSGAFAVSRTGAANGVAIQPAVAGQFPTIGSYGTDPNPGLVLLAQGAGQVIAQSLLNANKGLYVSASAQFTVPVNVATYTVSTLPTAGVAGRVAFATNARMLTPSGSYVAQQAAGAGSGGLVVDDGVGWRIAGTNISAAA